MFFSALDNYILSITTVVSGMARIICVINIIAASAYALTITYDFESDTTGNPPSGTTPQMGIFNIVNDFAGNTSKSIRSASNTATTQNVNLDNFIAASDYSIIWKQSATSNSYRNGFILRAQGLPYSSVSNSTTPRGYVFLVSAAAKTLSIYKTSSGVPTTILSTFALAPQPINTPRWFRATASGTALSFDYSDTSEAGPWISGISVTDTTYTNVGKTGYLDGFGGTFGIVAVDNVTMHIASLEPPSGVTAAAGNAQATVFWKEPETNGGAPITLYTVTSTPGSFTYTTTSKSCVVSGLTNLTPYTFTVTATNAIGASATSVASNAIIPQSSTADSYSIAGPSSGNAGSASASYTVMPIGGDYTGTITITPTGSGSAGMEPIHLTFTNSSSPQSFQITPTVAGSITLTFTNGGTLNNPPALAYKVDAVAPDPPTGVSALAGNTQASVSWNPPAFNGGLPITSYTVTSTPGSFTSTTSSSSCTMTGLNNLTSYTFTVTATNAVGTSVASSASSAVTLAAIGKPAYLLATPMDGGAHIQWSKVPGSSGYIVNYRQQGNAAWESVTGTNSEVTLGCTIASLTNGVNYEVKVTAISTLGNSPPSDIQTFVPTSISPLNYYNQILSTGQSLSIGVSGGAALTTVQLYGNKQLKALNGANFNGNTATMQSSDYLGLKPLAEPNTNSWTGTEESPASAMGNMLSSLVLPGTYDSIVSLHGIGSQLYEALKKGGSLPAYANGQVQAQCAMGFSLAAGRPYRISGLTVIHGERDEALGTSATSYESHLVQWQSDYESDAKALTGQAQSVPLFLNQNSSWVGYGHATPTIALGQLAAARNNPDKIFLVMPHYIFDYVDHAHIFNWEYRRMGEYFGKVMKKVLVDGKRWKPTMPESISCSGNIIDVRFHVPVPPLVFDTSAVVPHANYGFEYYDSTSSAIISSVQIIGGDTVRVILSQAPTGSNKTLRYAYTGNVTSQKQGSRYSESAAGNLRDSDETEALYQDVNVPSWAGPYLRNWSVTFSDPITSSASAVQSLLAESHGDSVGLSWNPPADSGGSIIVDYIIEFKSSTSPVWTIYNDGVSSATEATVSGLISGAAYDFRISAVNALGKGLLSPIVTSPSPSPYTTWQESNFSAADMVSGLTSMFHDYDHDGMSNLLEYAFGNNPKVADVAQIVANVSEGKVQISFPCNAARTDITYTVQASSTLAANSWIDIAESIGGGVTVPKNNSICSVSDSGIGLRIVTVTENNAFTGVARFLRIQVTSP